MPEYLGDALFELRANVAPLKAGMMEAESLVSASTRRMQGSLAQGLGSMSSKLGHTGASLTRMVTVPILGIGAASAKMAIDFQAAMENIHTQAGASQKEVDKLSKSVMGLSKSVPFGPTALADALYHLESIGLRLTKRFEQQGIQVRKQIPLMQVLKVAAEGAAVGHANLEQTTTALGSAWLSGIPGATNLGKAMGTLNAIIGTGNMRMGDLVSALGTGVLPMAKLAGLSLQDVGAALAVMSDEGYNATSAATQMGTALHYLFDPTQKASNALAEIGLHSGALAGDMHKPKGLLTALTDLKSHLDSAFPASKGHALTAAQTAHAVDMFSKSLEQSGVSGKKMTDAVDKYKLKLKELGSSEVAQEAVLGDIFPAGRGRVLLVLMNQLANYDAKLGQINRNQKKFAGDVRSTQETAAYKIHQAWASIQSDMTNFGEHVLPPLVAGIQGVAKEIDKVGTAFGKLSPETQKAIITGGLITAAVGPAMRVASFFMGGVGKLLSAATIASRLAGGQGWSKAFGSTTAGGTRGGGALSEIAEMRVNQMMVAELVAKSIPGVGGTGSRVPGARGVGRSVAGTALAEAESGPQAPAGYVYDPVLGMNVKKATSSTPNVASVEAELAPAAGAAAARPRDPATGRFLSNAQIARQRPRNLSGQFISQAELEAGNAAYVAEGARPVGAAANVRGVMARTSGRLSAEEALQLAYPGARFGAPEALTSVSEEEAATRAAEKEARGSLGSRALSGIKGVGSAVGRAGSRALGGFAIGSIGVLASQTIGGAIKGSVGSAIKEIGTDASVGAGLGAIFGPEGAAGGAIIGGLVGTFRHFVKTESHGGHLAGLVSSGFGNRAPESLAKTVADAQNAMDAITKRTVQVTGPRGQRMDQTTHVAFAALDPAQQAKYMLEAYKQGNAVAGQLEKGWNQYKFQDEPTMFVQLRSQMQHLVPQAQASAAMSAVKFAEGLEKSGRLPKGAAQKMLRMVEQEFPKFAQYLGLSADASVKQFTKAMDFTKAEKNIHNTLNTVAYKDFPQVQAALELTRGSVADKSAAVIKSLQGIQRSGSGPARAGATKDIAAIRASWTKDLTAAATLVEQKSGDMSNSLKHHSQDAMNVASTNFATLATNIGQAMAAGVIGVTKGMTLLANAANATLVAFGGAKVPVPLLKQMSVKDLKLLTTTPQGRSAAANYGGYGAAKGGLFQIGNPGDRGGDTVPLSILAGRGEKVAVFNATQQAVMDRRLSDYGGLDGMFASHAQRHSETPRFATGGIVAASDFGGPGDPGTGSVGYKGDNLYQHPDSYAELDMGTALGHLPYMTPLMVGYHGKRARLLKRDIGRGGPGIGGHPRAIDLWFQAAAALGFNGLDLVSVASDGQANVNITGGSAAGAGGPPPQLRVPEIKGRGVIADTDRAALKKATKQVNDYISQHVSMMPAAGGAGVNAGVSGAGLPSGVGIFDGHPVDKWIIPILDWARAHGWGGAVSSGYRDPAHQLAAAESYGLSHYGPAGPLGSNHLKPNYPGGAVDVSDSSGLAAVLRNYPGKPNLVWGGPVMGDEVHFSATGHALGGIIEASSGLPPHVAEARNKKPLNQAKANWGWNPPWANKLKKKAHVPTLAELTTAYGKVTTLENDLAAKLGQYDSVSSRYSTDEGQLQYLNDDGSLNPAGVAKKTADDKDLLSRAQAILSDYQAELGPVTTQLKDWLGAKSHTQSKIEADTKKLTVLTNKLTGIKAAETALSKPMKDEVTPLTKAEAKVHDKWDPIIKDAEKAEHLYHPGVFAAQPVPAKASTAERRRIEAANAAGRVAFNSRVAARRHALSDAVTLARSTEDNALNPLKDALLAARDARKKHANQTAAARYKLRVERDKVEADEKPLRADISTLKGVITTGTGNEEGDDKRISLLESVGGKLGLLEWSGSGKFLGINTKQQGAAYDEQTTIDSLKITLGQDANLTQPTTDDSQALADAQALAGYWQNIAEQNAQEAYVREHQLGTIGGVSPMLGPFSPTGPRFSAYQQLPPYAGSFAQGGIVPGPIGAPATAIVHGQEKITPPDASGGAVHLHFANGMGWLKDYVSASVEESTRGMARRAARRMPSQGGGIVYAR